VQESKKKGKLVIKFSGAKGLGENLFWTIGSNDCSKANKAWYSEIKNYDFNKNGPKIGKGFHNIGHFTQVVWKGTTQFGFGIAVGKFGRYWDMYKMPQVFIVARYQTPGNFAGRFKENVKPLVQHG